jgi:hypothetical protein
MSELNGKKCGNQTLKISFYQPKQKFAPPNFLMPIAAPVNNDHSNIDYRVLYITKMSKRVSATFTSFAGHRARTIEDVQQVRSSDKLPDQAHSCTHFIRQSSGYVCKQRGRSCRELKTIL